MNPSFEAEKKLYLAKAAADTALKQASLQWIIDSAKLKYSYQFTWLGRPVIQYPPDIIAVQEIIWKVKPKVVVETGIAHGGSLIFSASMLELLGGNGKVVGVDIDIREHCRTAVAEHPMSKRIQMIQGSAIDPAIVAEVAAAVGGAGPVLVILDSNHTHEHVLKELELYSPLVGAGSYLIVMDTIIEDMPAGSFPDRTWGKGNSPKSAVYEFLKTNDRFRIDTDMNAKLMISVAPDGYLECVKDAK